VRERRKGEREEVDDNGAGIDRRPKSFDAEISARGMGLEKSVLLLLCHAQDRDVTIIPPSPD
jgi:hypothetical protein